MSELAAAAERLRNHSIGPHLFKHGGDMATLAAAYLAEHPADDATPLDEAWLRSVGFAEVESDLGPRYANHFEISVPGKGMFNIWKYYDEWVINGYDSFPFKTRGDVRALARVLVIPLTGDVQ